MVSQTIALSLSLLTAVVTPVSLRDHLAWWDDEWCPAGSSPSPRSRYLWAPAQHFWHDERSGLRSGVCEGQSRPESACTLWSQEAWCFPTWDEPWVYCISIRSEDLTPAHFWPIFRLTLIKTASHAWSWTVLHWNDQAFPSFSWAIYLLTYIYLVRLKSNYL